MQQIVSRFLLALWFELCSGVRQGAVNTLALSTLRQARRRGSLNSFLNGPTTSLIRKVGSRNVPVRLLRQFATEGTKSSDP